MMKEFEKIFSESIKAREENKKQHEIYLLNKKKEEEEKENKIIQYRKNNIVKLDYNTDCISKELLKLIKKFDFKIESYNQDGRLDYSDEYYYCDSINETYYCNKNNWNFTINNLADVDIEEGIYSISELKNIITNETIDFYCDLGCRNTGEDRREEFIELLNYNSLDDYVKVKFKEYIELPNLLKEKGYNVKEEDYSFGLNDTKGCLYVGDNTYIRLYRAWGDEIRMVVTNDKKWDVNSSNNGLYGTGKKAYWFDYKTKNDLDELIKCIECFKEDKSGKIGYFENNNYYKNGDIIDYFDSIMNLIKKNKETYDIYNHSLLEIEHTKPWDRGYNDDPKNINKYLGIEIWTSTEITFNDSSWGEGNIKNKSIIEVEYNTKENKDKCKLTIVNYIYEDDDDIYEYDDEKEESYYKNENSKIEIYGTFLEIYEYIKEYMNTMIKINLNIDLENIK